MLESGIISSFICFFFLLFEMFFYVIFSFSYKFIEENKMHDKFNECIFTAIYHDLRQDVTLITITTYTNPLTHSINDILYN